MSVDPTTTAMPTAAAERTIVRYHGRLDREVDDFFLNSSDRGKGPDLSFGDFLDVINPLQHIPGVNEIYRNVTGDEISPQAKVVGATLYGGPVGLVASAFTTVFEQASGSSVTNTLMAAVGLGDETGTAGTAGTAGKGAVSTPAAVTVADNALQTAPQTTQQAMTEPVADKATPEPVQVAAAAMQQNSSVRPIISAPAGSAAVNSADTVFVTPATAATGVAASADQPGRTAGRSAFMDRLMQNRGVNTGAVNLSAEQRAIAADALEATNASSAAMQNQARVDRSAEEGDIPTLSDGSMNAILQAFGQKPREPQESDVVTSEVTGQSARIAQPAADPLAMMQHALDQYQKMKTAQQTNVVKEAL